MILAGFSVLIFKKSKLWLDLTEGQEWISLILVDQMDTFIVKSLKLVDLNSHDFTVLKRHFLEST